MQDTVNRPAAVPVNLLGWGGAVHFLMALHFINWIGFAGWNAMLHNYTIEKLAFGWFEAGLTQTVREIPGFLAFTAIFWLMWFREQTVAYVSLIVLGLGVALSGQISSTTGMLIATFIMSVGFHYFETINKSLQLQLLPKAQAPALIGRIVSAGAAAQFTTYGALALAGTLGWQVSKTSYDGLFLLIGALCIVLTAGAFMFFGRFQGPVPQRKELILRKRYWLYYLMTFMSGARRQLFFAFGGFLLVKKFGFSVFDTAKLMLVTTALNFMLASRLGRLVTIFGERRSIMFENAVLIAVFIGYALTSDWRVAAGLFVIDGLFFTLILAQGTYFQKIADPADVASTVSVAFTINHIAAVAIPVSFGLIGGLVDPAIIFWLGAGIATTSLGLSFLVPRHPAPGHETMLLPQLKVQPAE
ncbi:MAG: MFS transporter [Hyphomicrobiaceae bacterium]